MDYRRLMHQALPLHLMPPIFPDGRWMDLFRYCVWTNDALTTWFSKSRYHNFPNSTSNVLCFALAGLQASGLWCTAKRLLFLPRPSRRCKIRLRAPRAMPAASPLAFAISPTCFCINKKGVPSGSVIMCGDNYTSAQHCSMLRPQVITSHHN